MRLPRARRARHEDEASFSASTIYYTYCFSLPPGTSIAELADTLLSRGVATAAVWAADPEVRVAHRYSDLHKNMQRARAVADLKKVQDGHLSAIAWGKQNPALGLSYLAFRAKRIGRTRPSKASPGPGQSIGEQLERQVEVSEEAMVRTRLFLGMYHGIESEFYAPGYLQHDPFIRLELRSFRVTSEYYDNEPVLPFLLLHESGVALLTYATAPKDHIGTGGIIELSRGDAFHIEHAYVHREFFGSTDPEIAAAAASDVHDGTGWAEVTWEEKRSFSDLFEIHLDRILEACGSRRSRYGDWHCYSTVVLNHLDCCSTRALWQNNHQQELIGLANRVPGYASLNGSLTIPKDDSLTVDHSRFWQISHCLDVRWEFGSVPRRPAATQDHWVNVLVEHVLLQLWQLRQLDWRISTHDWTPKALDQLQTEIAIGLEEYRRTDVVAFGTARDTAHALLAEHGADELYQRILDRLNALAAVVSAREARASSRRNVVTAGAAVLAAIALGLPAIAQSISLLQTTTRGRIGGIVAPLRDFTIRHPNSFWFGYLVLLIIATTLLGYSLTSAPRRRRTKLKRGNVGLSWPGISLRIVHARPKYDHGEARRTGKGGASNQTVATTRPGGENTRPPNQRSK
jgi:hypothetical protein